MLCDCATWGGGKMCSDIDFCIFWGKVVGCVGFAISYR